ncbi:MAG: hypothetical protein ACRDD1_04630, partial [Planctomycetia bacterium]
MMDPREEAQRLFFAANDLPDGAVKVAMLEEAVQLADSCQDVALGYELRDSLMSAAVHSGRYDVVLVAFSWSLATFDQDPRRFDTDGLLWKYKWVIEHGWKFPQIERARLDALFGDFENRYRAAGYSIEPVCRLRRGFAVHLGDHLLARRADEALREFRRGSMSDCVACIADDDSRYHRFEREWELSLQAAQDVLEGRFRCAEQPVILFGAVLL